jgi:hypothetical protein
MINRLKEMDTEGDEAYRVYEEAMVVIFTQNRDNWEQIWTDIKEDRGPNMESDEKREEEMAIERIPLSDGFKLKILKLRVKKKNDKLRKLAFRLMEMQDRKREKSYQWG